jgi:hypothetical protein
MASFTTRVELHGASYDDYNNLHAAMERAGFKRYLLGAVNGVNKAYAMPTAEYDFESNLDCSQVRDLAKRIADGVKLGAWVLTTQVAARAWNTKQLQNA